MFETETRLAVYNYKPSLSFLLKFVMVASVIFIAICLRFSSGVIKIDLLFALLVCFLLSILRLNTTDFCTRFCS